MRQADDETGGPLRLLLIHQPADRERSEVALIRALEGAFDLTRVEVGDDWAGGLGEIPDHQDHDAVMVFVRWRLMATRPPIDWAGFDGPRVIHDHDAYVEFSSLTDRRPAAWVEMYHRHRFDLAIVTGRDTAARLRDQKVSATWIPKGYDPARFFDLGGSRQGICTYGTPYRARRAMARYVRTRGLPVDRVAARYEELNGCLNRYAACLVCNMEARVRLGRFGRLVERRWPGALLDVRPGPEPMIKNFEAAASGCAVFADWILELEDLGFRDGDNVVLYRTFAELVERLRSTGPDELRRIGASGAVFVAGRHTWAHRMPAFAEAIGALL